MPYLSAATHAAIVADPRYISAAWMLAQRNFKQDIGSAFAGRPDDMIAAGFCAITAYDMKPYGACTARDLGGILDSAVLDCDNYCLLAWYLFTILKPSTDVELAMVGWNGGAVGNHAQLLATIGDTSAWLLDPTIGLIAGGATFNRICQGAPITAMTQPAGVRDSAYSKTIRDALSSGAYKPSDLLYYFSPVSKYVANPPRHHWGTPQS